MKKAQLKKTQPVDGQGRVFFILRPVGRRTCLTADAGLDEAFFILHRREPMEGKPANQSNLGEVFNFVISCSVVWRALPVAQNVGSDPILH